MSSYQKTRNEKRTNKFMTLWVENDIPVEEFNHYYQKCQENKKQRLQAKQLKTETTVTKEEVHKPTGTQTATNDVTAFDCSKYVDKYDDDYNEYEEWYNNEEIDRAFEEAERWSDF